MLDVFKINFVWNLNNKIKKKPISVFNNIYIYAHMYVYIHMCVYIYMLPNITYISFRFYKYKWNYYMHEYL